MVKSTGAAHGVALAIAVHVYDLPSPPWQRARTEDEFGVGCVTESATREPKQRVCGLYSTLLVRFISERRWTVGGTIARIDSGVTLERADENVRLLRPSGRGFVRVFRNTVVVGTLVQSYAGLGGGRLVHIVVRRQITVNSTVEPILFNRLRTDVTRFASWTTRRGRLGHPRCEIQSAFRRHRYAERTTDREFSDTLFFFFPPCTSVRANGRGFSSTAATLSGRQIANDRYGGGAQTVWPRAAPEREAALAAVPAFRRALVRPGTSEIRNDDRRDRDRPDVTGTAAAAETADKRETAAAVRDVAGPSASRDASSGRRFAAAGRTWQRRDYRFLAPRPAPPLVIYRSPARRRARAHTRAHTHAHTLAHRHGRTHAHTHTPSVITLHCRRRTRSLVVVFVRRRNFRVRHTAPHTTRPLSTNSTRNVTVCFNFFYIPTVIFGSYRLPAQRTRSQEHIHHVRRV